MARKKKDGKRATGIQSKKGWLYILTTKNVVDNNGHIKIRNTGYLQVLKTHLKISIKLSKCEKGSWLTHLP